MPFHLRSKSTLTIHHHFWQSTIHMQYVAYTLSSRNPKIHYVVSSDKMDYITQFNHCWFLSPKLPTSLMVKLKNRCGAFPYRLSSFSIGYVIADVQPKAFPARFITLTTFYSNEEWWAYLRVNLGVRRTLWIGPFAQCGNLRIYLMSILAIIQL